MNTIRREASEDAHVIYGTACDESLGDQLRVTVIATGLSSTARRAERPDRASIPGLSVVQPQQTLQPALRTGTDNVPILTSLAQPPVQGSAQPQDFSGLNTPSVWRSARSQAAAKVDALASNGMDEIEIPAFLRKQAD